MNGDTKLRVYNRCNYDIGVTLTSGRAPNIRAGSFLPMTVDDILYIESASGYFMPFSSRKLVAVSPEGKDLTLEDIGGYTNEYAEVHSSKEEIIANLNKPYKTVEKWLSKITDPIELHAISEVAIQLDLPGSKLKLIQAKVPNVDLLAQNEE